jgi:hypothetical protein
VSPRECTQRRKGELWARNVRKFCLNADFHFIFRDLFHALHAVNYDMGPTALLPLRRKACWGFFRPKNPKASAACEPANLGTKGQHATSRPPKPLSYVYMCGRLKCGTENISESVDINLCKHIYLLVTGKTPLESSAISVPSWIKIFQ